MGIEKAQRKDEREKKYGKNLNKIEREEER
jgi:hypothetical protein